MHLLAVWRYGVNVPYWDDWGFGDLLIRWHTGRAGFLDLFEQQNESRPFFPRLLLLPMAAATGWNLRYQMFASFAVACVTAFALVMLARRTLAGAG